MIYAFYKTDAHLRCLKILLDRLEWVENYKLHYANYLKDDFRNLESNVAEILKSPYIFLSLGSRDVFLLCRWLKDIGYTGSTVAMFPGIVTKNQIDVFASRIYSDYIICDEITQFKFYTNLQKLSRGKTATPVQSRMAWLSDNEIKRDVEPKTLGIILQADLISKVDADRLIELLKKKSDVGLILVKMRASDYLVSQLVLLEKFRFVEYDELLAKSEIIVTISSSGIFEAIARDIDCQIWDLFTGEIHTSYFKDSGLVCKNINDLSQKKVINVQWLSQFFLNQMNFSLGGFKVKLSFTKWELIYFGLLVRFISPISLLYDIRSWTRWWQWLKNIYKL